MRLKLSVGANDKTNLSSSTSGAMYRFVPTRAVLLISMRFVVWLWVTARPKSAMTQVPLIRTKIFFVFRSR